MASSKLTPSKDPLQCEHCGRVFKYNSKLSRHLLVHTKSKEFKCNYCDAAFSLSHNLKVHMRIHMGIKPFKCAYPGCDKMFTQSCNMKVHMKTHSFNQSRIIFKRYEILGVELDERGKMENFRKDEEDEVTQEVEEFEEVYIKKEHIELENGQSDEENARCHEEIREFDMETDDSDDPFCF